jgi:hypothetical protein
MINLGQVAWCPGVVTPAKAATGTGDGRRPASGRRSSAA